MLIPVGLTSTLGGLAIQRGWTAPPVWLCTLDSLWGYNAKQHGADRFLVLTELRAAVFTCSRITLWSSTQGDSSSEAAPDAERRT